MAVIIELPSGIIITVENEEYEPEDPEGEEFIPEDEDKEPVIMPFKTV